MKSYLAIAFSISHPSIFPCVGIDSKTAFTSGLSAAYVADTVDHPSLTIDPLSPPEQVTLLKKDAAHSSAYIYSSLVICKL